VPEVCRCRKAIEFGEMAIDPQPPQFTVQHAQANGCRGVQHLQFGALVLRLPLQFRVAQGAAASSCFRVARSALS